MRVSKLRLIKFKSGLKLDDVMRRGLKLLSILFPRSCLRNVVDDGVVFVVAVDVVVAVAVKRSIHAVVVRARCHSI